MGGIGRDRTFVVHDRFADLKLPSDLAGVTTATFEPRGDRNLQAALGAVCSRIIQVLHTLGKRSAMDRPTGASSRSARSLSVPPSIMVTGGRNVIVPTSERLSMRPTSLADLSQNEMCIFYLA
jgi:hypothetical protein